MKNFVFSSLLLFSGCSFAIESIHLQDVKILSASYQSVSVCGEWQSKSQEGYRRIVVTDAFKAVGSEIYIQTIVNPTQDSDARVVETIPISELNNDHSQYTIQSVRCKGKGGAAYVEVMAQYEHDEDDRLHKFVIHILGNSTYKLLKVK